jgi:transposase-like protein
MSEETKMSLVKSDCLGRRQYGAEYRREAVAAFARSGQSAKGFAGQLGVKYSTFASWVAKARRGLPGRREEPGSREAPQFLLAEIGPESAGRTGEVSVSLPGGAVARAGNREEVLLLAELIRALA